MKKSGLLLSMLLVASSLSAAASAVEKLEGTAAVEHLAALRAEKAKLFRKAEARMLERGFKSTDIVAVARTEQKGIQPAQSTYSNSSGEILIWSWDDGDDSTWEGTIYVEDYARGGTALWDVQLDVSTNTPQTLWSEYLGGKEADATKFASAADSPVPQIASLHGGLPAPQIDLVQLRDRRYNVADFLECVLDGCSYAAMYCLTDGGNWGACMLLRCGSWALACGIRYLI